jgi:hypothetical protein
VNRSAIFVAASMAACASCGVLVDFDGYRPAGAEPADSELVDQEPAEPTDTEPAGTEPAGTELPAGRQSASPSNVGQGLNAPSVAGGPGDTPPSPEPPIVTVFQSYWFERGAASFPVSDAEGLARSSAMESRTLVPGSFATARGGGLELDAAGSFVYRPPGTAGAFWGDDYIEYAFAGEPAVRGRARLTVQPRLVDLPELAASSGAGWGVAGAFAQDQVGSTLAGQLPVRRRPFAPAGDVNGDGLEDFVIGVLGPAQQYDNGVPYGEGRGAYVLFGKKGASNISLAELSGSVPPAGFAILDDLANGAADSLGYSVAGAGDVDGDGLDDVIVGSHGSSLGCSLDDAGCGPVGAAYVIFGKRDSEAVHLERLRAGLGGGFAILPPSGVPPNGGPSYFFAGFSVDKAGDVNGDGLGDVIVGVPFFTPGGDSVLATPAQVSAPHVIFGKRGAEPVQLENVANGQGGFPILATPQDLGFQVAGVGDMNGDGLDDVAMSSEFYFDSAGARGRVLVVLGKQDTRPVLLADIEAGSREGFFILGADDGDYTGTPVYGGDVNGDGFDDLVIASPYATPATAPAPDETPVNAAVDAGVVGDAGVDVDATSGPAECPSPPCPAPRGEPEGGQVYVLYGTRDFRDIRLQWYEGEGVPEGYFPPEADVGELLWGTAASDHMGYSVSSGDVDGDGFGDVIVSRDPTKWGDAIVVFGTSAGLAPGILRVGSSNSNSNGSSSGNSTEQVCASAVSGADTNGDGFDDLLVSSELYADAPEGAGGADVVFGWDFTQAQAGRDVALLGGPGDDVLSLPATPVVVVKGGHGNDTLKVGSSTRTLDLTQPGRYQSLEVIDMRGGGPQDVLLNDAAVRRLPENRGEDSFGLARRLIVWGDAEDHLHFDATGYNELGTTPGGRVYGRTGAHYGLEVSSELLPFSAP